MATRKPNTPEATWASVREGKLDDLAAEFEKMTSAEADAFLDANGGDAAGTRRRAAAQIAAIEQRPEAAPAVADWQAEARAKLDAARATFAAVRARRPKLARAELEVRVLAAKTDPRYAQPVATFFRKRTTSETTDAELEALLDEIEALRELVAKKESK